MTTAIKFGTDGWRAIIADEFTFANVARCTQGLMDYLGETGTAGQGLVVGYDTPVPVPGVCRDRRRSLRRQWRPGLPLPDGGANPGGQL